MSEGSFCRYSSGHGSNISNHYYFDMMLAKNTSHSSVFYINAETFDYRLRTTRKILLSQLVRNQSDGSLYQSGVSVCVVQC
jgi:hypothetical protein